LLKVLLLFSLGIALGLFGLFVWAHYHCRPIADTRADRIVVEKAARRMTLFRGPTALKNYRVALGREPVGPKREEGDHRTPEGLYKIDWRKPNSDFHLALHISYPNAGDIAQAETRGASAGNDIMIHGLRNGSGWIGKLHRRTDWTDGCVAVTNQEIEEIWRVVPDGTPVEIRP
jgi:murein L,D-transpeptidase YafK